MLLGFFKYTKIFLKTSYINQAKMTVYNYLSKRWFNEISLNVWFSQYLVRTSRTQKLLNQPKRISSLIKKSLKLNLK